MTKRENSRRCSKRPAGHATPPSTSVDHRRRSKGRARTRASGVKIIDDPMADEKKLKGQLTQMGFYAVNTLGDGNCLFRALSDQLYGTPNRHLEIRNQVCTYLAQHESRYKAFVDMDEEESWESHLQQMAKQGTYGGHLELSAFANFHRRPIKIIQPGMVYVISYEDGSLGSSSKKFKGKAKEKGRKLDEITPISSSDTPVYLVYHQWEHYSSVRNLDGPHSGIPCIRERNLESSVSINQPDKQKDKHTSGSSDPSRLTVKEDSLSDLSTYRECSSSPTSARSTTTESSVIKSVSSPSSSPSTAETHHSSDKSDPQVDQIPTLSTSIANSDSGTSNYPKRNKRTSTLISNRDKAETESCEKITKLPQRQQRTRPHEELKPLSKKAQRQAFKKNKYSRNPSDPCPQEEYKIDTLGLKELKV